MAIITIAMYSRSVGANLRVKDGPRLFPQVGPGRIVVDPNTASGVHLRPSLIPIHVPVETDESGTDGSEPGFREVLSDIWQEGSPPPLSDPKELQSGHKPAPGRPRGHTGSRSSRIPLPHKATRRPSAHRKPEEIPAVVITQPVLTVPSPTAPKAPSEQLVSRSNGDKSRIPLLVIGIPSIQRRGDVDYMSRTLKYIASAMTSTPMQSPALLAGVGLDLNTVDIAALKIDPSASNVPGGLPLRVRILTVSNTRPGTTGHAVWEHDAAAVCGASENEATALSEHYLSDSVASMLAYVGALQTYGSCSARVVDGAFVLQRDDSPFAFALNLNEVIQDGQDEGDPNVPGARVRRQTRDVVHVMHTAYSIFAQDADYYMFQEDDFRLCPRGGETLAFLLQTATAYHPDWNAIRVSYGLNGAIIRMADVPVLASYYTEHVARRPPDHMTVEWFAGEKPQSSAQKRGRPHVAFRYNILEHFGFASSLRDKATPHYAMCYDTLDATVVFDVEAFKPECDHTYVWPCPQPVTAPPPVTLSFNLLKEEAKKDTAQTWANPDAKR
jgi:hypothetical protein